MDTDATIIHAIVKHESIPGVAEDIWLQGAIDNHGVVIWEDPFKVLDGKCEFTAIWKGEN